MSNKHICPTIAGGLSTASTVPATDQEALENARRGVAEARMLEQGAMPSAAAISQQVHGTVRVGNVPVLQTPPSKIRRRGTVNLSAPKEAELKVAGVVDPAKASKKKKVKKEKKSKKKNKAKKTKAATEDASQAVPEPEHEEHPGQSSNIPQQKEAEPEQDGGNDSGPPAAPEAPPGDPAASREADQEAKPASGVMSGSSPPKRPAAKKAAAVKPVIKEDPEDAKKLPEHEHKGPPGDRSSVKRSQSDNLLRATSSAQLTPSCCPPPGPDEDDLPPRTQEDAKENGEGDEESSEASDEVESPMLDDDDAKGAKEEKKKDAAADGTKEDDPKNDGKKEGADPKTPVRKEKTPAQKEAHARYMRFSRSLSSILAASFIWAATPWQLKYGTVIINFF